MVTLAAWGADSFRGDLRYTRVVSDELVAALKGPLHDIVTWRGEGLELRDV